MQHQKFLFLPKGKSAGRRSEGTIKYCEPTHEEGRTFLKEQKRELDEMLKMERKGANIPSLLQLNRKQPKRSQRSNIKINKLKAMIERQTRTGIPTALKGITRLAFAYNKNGWMTKPLITISV